MDYEDEFVATGAPAAFAFETQDDDDDQSQPFNFIEDADEDDAYDHGANSYSAGGADGLQCGPCDGGDGTAAGVDAGAPLDFVEDDERAPVRPASQRCAHSIIGSDQEVKHRVNPRVGQRRLGERCPPRGRARARASHARRVPQAHPRSHTQHAADAARRTLVVTPLLFPGPALQRKSSALPRREATAPPLIHISSWNVYVIRHTHTTQRRFIQQRHTRTRTGS